MGQVIELTIGQLPELWWDLDAAVADLAGFLRLAVRDCKDQTVIPTGTETAVSGEHRLTKFPDRRTETGTHDAVMVDDVSLPHGECLQLLVCRSHGCVQFLIELATLDGVALASGDDYWLAIEIITALDGHRAGERVIRRPDETCQLAPLVTPA